MSWLSVLPVMATLLVQAPASEPSAEPVVVPDGAGQAVAAPPILAPQAPPPPAGAATHWYGGPAVVADAAEMTLLYGLLRYNADYRAAHPGYQAPGATPAGVVLVVSTLVSGAVVHGIHHHSRRAVASVALRAGALLTSVLVVEEAANHCGQENPCDLVPILFAFPLAAMAIDDAFLAREPVPTAAPAQASWTPTLRIQSGLALLGVGGSF
jgi:hypothetical protein